MSARWHLRRAVAVAVTGLTVSVTAGALTAGVSSALPPVVTPPAGTYTFFIEADQSPCGRFQVDVVDGERYTTFFAKNGSVRVTGVNGSLRMHVTSLTSGKSINLNIPGPAKIYPSGDAVFTGAMFLFGPHTFAFIHGRAFLPGLDVDLAVVSGKRVDLCPILA
jgi:hypothetical protein